MDFVIWLLFRRHVGKYGPSHLLCLGYQRHAACRAGDEGVSVPGIPGVLSSCSNKHAESLRKGPWTALPALLGKGAERILSDMLLGCGLFTPVGNTSNVTQLCGLPMSELKIVKDSAGPRGKEGRQAKDIGTPNLQRVKPSLSNIRLARYRVLYARPSFSAKGKIGSGLGQAHVLNRLCDETSPEQTTTVMKYIFPRQFSLHNVFTSQIDPKDTAQPSKDYTLREAELARSEFTSKRKRAMKSSQVSSKTPFLPKRVRDDVYLLVASLRRRHARCPYHALLEHYCPATSHSVVGNETSLGAASAISEVSAYCRAVINKVFPAEFWGHGDVRDENRRAILRSINTFITLRRYESMSMHDVMQNVRVDAVGWLAGPNVGDQAKLSRTDFEKRKQLMAELLYYIFDSFLIPLLRGTFHVTESSVHRNQLFYFRHDAWDRLSAPALRSLKETMFEELSPASLKAMMATRALGVSHVRLLPKEKGMRPIINLRRRVQKLQHGEMVLGKSINSILTPAFSALNYEKGRHPEMLGSALFSVDDIFPRLQAFRQSLLTQGLSHAPLYFAKVDVRACFDTIPQKRLMTLVRRILIADEYRVSRYARSKLVGGQSEQTPGFGAKPSWKFLTKATAGDQAFNFDGEVEADVSEGRTRTVYVDGVVQKTEFRNAILDLLKEHVESNLVKIGGRFYRQKEGIPQGSIVSSILCSYVYAELERSVLGFLDDGQTLLLRLIDDFLVISTQRNVAEAFTRTMHAGVPAFGVQVKAGKSRANFDVSINGSSIARLPEATSFPYCGLAIDTRTLNITKDNERQRKGNLADSVTVEYSKIPGQSFYRKTLNSLKLQMHAMLLSTNYNSMETVRSNLYHSFAEVAQKSYHYIRSLPGHKQPPDKLVISKFIHRLSVRLLVHHWAVVTRMYDWVTGISA